MMNQPATSNQLYQLNFVKGVAILSVLLLHGGISIKYFSTYWIGQAVPLFIMVTCFLSCLTLSRNCSIKNYFQKGKIKKMLLRIFKPFISVQVIMIIIYSIENNFSIKEFMLSGGMGPGSYYPWIYLQLWMTIPFMFFLMKKNAIVGSILIILISVGINVLFVVFSSVDLFQISFLSNKRQALTALYRLFAGRYLFMFSLVFLFVEQKIKYKFILFFSFIGAGFIFFIVYKNANMEPIFYKSGWDMYEIPSHFYSLLVFIFLYKIYDYVPNALRNLIAKIGEHSWEIFNIQMIYFAFCDYLNINKCLNLMLSLFICIMPVCTYKFMEKPIRI
jgi:hypothetical protein